MSKWQTQKLQLIPRAFLICLLVILLVSEWHYHDQVNAQIMSSFGMARKTSQQLTAVLCSFVLHLLIIAQLQSWEVTFWHDRRLSSNQETRHNLHSFIQEAFRLPAKVLHFRSVSPPLAHLQQLQDAQRINTRQAAPRWPMLSLSLLQTFVL